MGIRFEVARDRLAKLQAKMSDQFASLKKCTVPRTTFEPMVRAALMIRPLKSTRPETHEADEWASLDAHIQGLCNRYACELGETGYAVERHHRFRITSTQESPHSSRSPRPATARQDRLTTFTHECARPGFAIATHGGKMKRSSQSTGALMTA